MFTSCTDLFGSGTDGERRPTGNWETDIGSGCDKDWTSAALLPRELAFIKLSLGISCDIIRHKNLSCVNVKYLLVVLVKAVAISV